MSQSDKSILLSKLHTRIREINKNLKYLKNEKFDKLDEKEKDAHAALWGEYVATHRLILEIRDTMQLARMPTSWNAYIEYKKRATRLKKEVNY